MCIFLQSLGYSTRESTNFEREPLKSGRGMGGGSDEESTEGGISEKGDRDLVGCEEELVGDEREEQVMNVDDVNQEEHGL